MESTSWSKDDFPYSVDYCDHFETPEQAYQDLKVILDVMFEKIGDKKVYDPYYCDGKASMLMKRVLGCQVIHEKRDFYKDIDQDTVPPHDILITNPPYSDTHKERCLTYCFENLRAKKRPFAVLLPNYVVARQYFAKMDLSDVIYLVPHSKYQYDHPEGTGKQDSPFDSIWIIGVSGKVPDPTPNPRFEIIASFSGLRNHKDMSALFRKRPNPRQRKKRALRHNGSVSTSKTCRANLKETRDSKQPSKYRDENGKRRRKRF